MSEEERSRFLSLSTPSGFFFRSYLYAVCKGLSVSSPKIFGLSLKVRVILSKASGNVGYETWTWVAVRSNSEQSSPKILNGMLSPESSSRSVAEIPTPLRTLAVNSVVERPVLFALIARMASRFRLGNMKASATFSPFMKSEAFFGGSGEPAFQICGACLF